MIAAFSPDGATLVYGNTNARAFTAEVWDLAHQRITDRAHLPPGPGDSSGIHALACDRKSHTLQLTGMSQDGTAPRVESLTTWDVSRDVITASTPGISGFALAVGPTGRLLVTAQGNVADLTAGSPIVRANGTGPAAALAFSSDGRSLAVGGYTGQTALWDGDVRHNLGTLTLTHQGSSGAVSALAFSADGSILAVGTRNGAIYLWDTATRQPIGSPLTTPGGLVAALEITKDTLYVAGSNIPFQRYDLTTTAAIAAICRRATHGLTLNDWKTHFPDYAHQPSCG
ncbi:WD40 repeat domain-containing protein [Nonomuraea sp. NPDC050556]|uniref:WD40 repeat domain-containing protein n=1 Tax=Nonomuraea sp. NPDC050556 TaxID=3364369 RepID=UPI00379CBED0